jgi:hypothetical protein
MQSNYKSYLRVVYLFDKFNKRRLEFKSNVEDVKGVAELLNILDSIAKDNNI